MQAPKIAADWKVPAWNLDTRNSNSQQQTKVAALAAPLPAPGAGPGNSNSHLKVDATQGAASDKPSNRDNADGGDEDLGESHGQVHLCLF